MTIEPRQDRWTDSLKRVVVAANTHASTTIPSPSVGTHRLLLALLEDPGEAESIFYDVRATSLEYLQAIRYVFSTEPSDDRATVSIELVFVTDESDDLPEPISTYSPAAVKALERAGDLAEDVAGELHLLAALLETTSVGTGILERQAAIPLAEMRENVMARLSNPT